MTLTIPDDPAALTEDIAQGIFEKLTALCRAQHWRAIKHGAVMGRKRCACGSLFVGGGALCRDLAALVEGGDEAQWINRAKALRDALEAAHGESERPSQPARPRCSPGAVCLCLPACG